MCEKVSDFTCAFNARPRKPLSVRYAIFKKYLRLQFTKKSTARMSFVRVCRTPNRFVTDGQNFRKDENIFVFQAGSYEPSVADAENGRATTEYEFRLGEFGAFG
jgi:hypothetical protein